MNYSYWLSTASSTVIQVYPLNWLETSLIDEREKDQQFYRRKLEGTLTFGGQKLCKDFETLWTLHQANPYARIELLILQGLNIYFEGYFSTANGTFDLKSRTFTVTPKTNDDYSGWAEDGDTEHNILDVPTLVTVECNGYSYTRNRWLIDVIEFLSDQVFPGCTVSSDFFTGLTDYVTLQPSKLLNLTIAQKSDIKRPTGDPATAGNMSFNEMASILRGLFNVFWTFDLATNVISFEHLSRYGATAGIDLRYQEIAKSLLTFRYENEDMPAREKWSFMEASSPDFRGGFISYSSPAVDESKTTEFNCRVTTDVQMIQTDPNSVSDEGFVLLINHESAGNYYTFIGPGLSDSTSRPNIYLAWSYLLQSYHRHGRILLSGYRNGILQTFVSAKKTIIHEINAIACPELGYRPERYITTELGENFLGGLKGYVKKANIRHYGEVNFTLMYGAADATNEGFSPSTKSLSVTLDELTGEVRSELSEPNVYDTYYSIWTNSDTCDVIMIPAGTLIQEDLLTQINNIVTAAYNFSDDSLSGWLLSVNGSATYDEATEGDCSAGSPAPPAIPAVPDIIGHSQASTCGPVTIGWTAEVGASYYVLQRNPDLGGNPVWLSLYIGANTSYQDPDAGVQEGVTFNYRVASANISGLSAWSAEHEVSDIIC